MFSPAFIQAYNLLHVYRLSAQSPSQPPKHEQSLREHSGAESVSKSSLMAIRHAAPTTAVYDVRGSTID